jgi:hypothetical protein
MGLAAALIACGALRTMAEPADAPPAEPPPLHPGPLGVSEAPPPVRPALVEPSPAPPGAPAPESKGPPVTIDYEYLEQWQEGPFLVVFLTGGVSIAKGPETLQADAIIVWKRTEGAAGGLAALDAVKTLDQVYAEGHVRMAKPGRGTIYAEAAFIDNQRHEGVFLDFRGRTVERRTKQAFVIRAAEARQVAENFFIAEPASITTCTYGTPHYDIHVRRVDFSHDPNTRGGTLDVSDILVRLDGVSLLYWPAISYDLGEPFPLRHVTFENSSRFGPSVHTEWGLIIKIPETDAEDPPPSDRRKPSAPKKWGDIRLDVDYRDKRGWATGIDLDYRWKDLYQGFLNTDYLHDRGRNLGNDFDRQLEAASPLQQADRGRTHAFHRQKLSDHWRAELEVNYVSDRDFLLEFFPNENRDEKEPETYGYLRGVYDTWAFTLLQRNRINDWQNQVEYMPKVGVYAVGQPLPMEILSGLYFFTTTEVANLRWNFDEAHALPVDSRRILRVDTANELWYPLHLGPVNVAPFVGGRWSWFQETLFEDSPEDRFVGTGGARAEVKAHHVYHVTWDLIGLNDLRHIVSGEVRYTNAYACTIPSDDLIAYDHVEGADKFQEIAVSLTQRFQTKVGPPEKRMIIDFLTLHTAIEFYPDPERDTTQRRIQNYLSPFNWITLPPEPDGVTFAERRYSNLFWFAELTPSGRLSLRADGEYNLKDRRPEVTDLTGSAAPFDWIQVSVGYYNSHDVTESVRVTTFLRPSPRLNLYALYGYDLHSRAVMERKVAAQWDFHDAYLEVSVSIDPIHDEKKYLVGVTPKFGTRHFGVFHDLVSGTPSRY